MSEELLYKHNPVFKVEKLLRESKITLFTQ